MMSRREILSISLLTASAIAGLVQNLYIAVPLLAIGIAARAKRKAAGQDRINTDTYNFLNGLAKELDKSGNLGRSAELACGSDYLFSNSLRRALKRYQETSDAETSFKALDEFHSAFLSEAALLIAKGLHTGKDVSSQLNDLVERLEERQRTTLKVVGIASNAFSINRIGSAVFFPLFAGIGINIIGFAGTMGGNSIDTTGITAIMLGYIAISNFINARYDGKTVSRITENFAMYSSIGVILFRLSSVLAFGI